MFRFVSTVDEETRQIEALPPLTDGCSCPSVGDASRRALFFFVCVCCCGLSFISSSSLSLPPFPFLFFSPFHSFNTLRCSRLVSLSFACILAFFFLCVALLPAFSFFFYLAFGFFFFFFFVVAFFFFGHKIFLELLLSLLVHLCPSLT